MLCDPDNETFPIPSKYVDAMRQTQMSLNNVSEHIVTVHMKIHHDRLFVIDVEAAQNSLEVHQAANGSTLCYGTVLAEFLTKIINMKDGSKRFVRGEFEEEESSPTKRIRRDRGQPREASWHEVKQKTLETRQLGEFSSTADILEENKISEVHAQCNCTKRNRLRTRFCRCGKKAWQIDSFTSN